MRVALGVLWLLALRPPPQAWSSCPPRCSCSRQVLGEGSMARTVLCNDPDMTLPPAAVPPDTRRLRLERTAIRRVPAAAFAALRRLEQLWLPHNALRRLGARPLRGLGRLRELRLPGNRLAAFPWAALGDAPRLRLLDLQANRLAAVPPGAARFLRALAFLDLSSNRLLRLPPALLAAWGPRPTAPAPPGRPGLVLGLQDNPWVCDCRLHDLVHFLDGKAPHLALIEAGLRCAGPGGLAGVAFGQLQLRRCQGPELRPAVASVRSPLGSTVLLRCGATGVPEPQMSWRRVSGRPLNGTVHQQVSRDGTSWALLGLPAVSHLDAGDYVCQASNFLGASETITSLVIAEPQASTEHSGSPGAPRAGTGEGPGAAVYNRLVARRAPPTPGPAGPSTEDVGPTGPQEARTVMALKVVGDTRRSVTLVWKAPRAGGAALSILYAALGQRAMRRVAVPPGRTRVTLRGLLPETKYVACVCAWGLAPRKEQCVVFSPDEVADAEATQRLINAVVASVAAVIALPLTLLVSCGALRRRCRRGRAGRSAQAPSTYLSLDALSLGLGEDSGARPQPSLSEADGLLSIRAGSSLDSAPGDASRGGWVGEYLC
ncbi:leucine-rich repeat, immunoglobulin-like domain and transmembrane domain-containing protein 1 [Pipistrellus kuhlii]|uniref:Leucine rich repeat, Ig-like and transmembrane domains 1 n=1 Tax=Pipistrellus kuhlii TaxID=59472 RepID=A0A7J7T0Y1_PIPKU|nr:leucine-rich repeat, immunoglobulin-like domain and transmembrane domain-containing protein 1 [Pipistrellus kuhlii]KAF6294153.1 leucine rich repeat, Ig-like and transmembrane domains 1 [Pipistrellus kuhlii]